MSLLKKFISSRGIFFFLFILFIILLWPVLSPVDERFETISYSQRPVLSNSTYYPKRSEQIKFLKNDHKKFDVLVIGGGATGASVALEATIRGLSVALVEAKDFSSGTSSRSTKLAHGGVRYLEKAFKNLDYGQYKLVKESLKERLNFLENAPHLAHQLAIVTPIYSWIELPYYYLGLKIYDFLAGNRNLAPSKFLSSQKTQALFPHIEGKKLKGSILYYDGQFNDGRMNLSLALTATYKGARIANYLKVDQLLKNKNGKVKGAWVQDQWTQESWPIKAKAVINATGVFSDHIRKMSNPQADEILSPARGTHIILDGKYTKNGQGLLIPKTKDGRVIFLLPWLNHTLVGTTDHPDRPTYYPGPQADEITYLINHINDYFETKLTHNDVLSAWTGLRPLVNLNLKGDQSNSTQKILRDHYIEVDPAGLITIAGGKWTTFRKMGQDTIEKAIETAHLRPKRSGVRKGVKLIGALHFHPDLINELRRKSKGQLSEATLQHLLYTYGDRAWEVAHISIKENLTAPIASNLPYIQGEIAYSIREEYAMSVEDILARRTRLAFLEYKAAQSAVEVILPILQKELNLTDDEIQAQEAQARAFLQTMSPIGA